MRTTEPEVRLLCQCGRSFMASARQARRVACGEITARCSECRRKAMQKPLSELKTPQLRKARLPVTDADRIWWLQRVPLDELVVIVAGLHGDVPDERYEWWARLEEELGERELQHVA